MKNIISIKSMSNTKSLVMLLLTIICLIFYIFGAYHFMLEGHEGYNLTRAHPWGLLLVVYEFFVALAMGLGIIGSSTIIFNIKAFKPFAVISILFGFLALCAGFSVFLFEIGHPIRMIIYTAISGHATSPLFWLGVFYPLFLFFSALTLFFTYKKEERKVRLFAIGTLLSAIASILTAGSIFGFLFAIPFSAGSFYPVQFILTAVLAAIYALALVFWLSDSTSEQTRVGIEKLGKFAGFIISILLIMYLTRFLSANYSSAVGLSVAIDGVYGSSLFIVFELFAALILPFVAIIFVKDNLAKVLGMLAIPALVGIMFSRYNLVEGLQYVPKQPLKVTEYADVLVPSFNYVPSISEISISLGGVGLCIALFFVGNLILKNLIKED